MVIDDIQELIAAIGGATKKAQPSKAVSPYALVGSKYLQGWTPKATVPPKKKKDPKAGLSTVLNFNDPNEMNSFADVLFNNQAYLAHPDLRQIPMSQPIKRFAFGMWDVINKGGIQPLIGDSNNDGRPDWDFGGLALNGLGNLIETMDVVANPIKGNIIEAVGNAPGGEWMQGSHAGVTGNEGFLRGLGIGAEGRTQYDYNVELGAGKFVNGAVNLILEFVSDPLNVLELAAKGVAKKVAKEIGNEALESATKAATKKFVTEVATATDDDAFDLIRVKFGDAAAAGYRTAQAQGADATKLYLDTLEETANQAIKSSKEFKTIVRQAARDAVYKGTTIATEIQESTRRAAYNKFRVEVWGSAGKKAAPVSFVNSDIIDALKLSAQDSLASRANLIVDSMGSLGRLTDDAQRYLVKSVLAVNPMGMGVLAAGALGKKALSKFKGTQFVARMLSKQFKDTKHITIDDLTRWNRSLEELAKLDPAKAANLNPTAQTMMQGSVAMYEELTDILDILARNTNATEAQQTIAAYIAKHHNGKTVQEYLDFLVANSQDATLNENVRALFAQQALKLNSQFKDLVTRVALDLAPGKKSALSLLRDESLQQIGKFMNELEAIKDVAVNNKWIYDLTDDATATYDLRSSWDDLTKRIEMAVKMADIPVFKVPGVDVDYTMLRQTAEREIDHAITAFRKSIGQKINAPVNGKLALMYKPGEMIRKETQTLIETIKASIARSLPPTVTAPDLDLLLEDVMTTSFAIKSTKQIKVLEDMVGYVVKNAQIHSALQLMNSKGLEKLVQYINTAQGIEVLEKLQVEINRTAGRALDAPDVELDYIRSFAKNYDTHLRFTDKITRLPELTPTITTVSRDDIAIAVLDAVESYAMRPTDQLIKDFPNIMDEIRRKVTAQINGSHATQSNKLVDVMHRTLELDEAANRARFVADLKARFGKRALTFHDADDDAIAAQYIAEANYPAARGHIFAFDIETTPSKHVVQIAWRYGDKSGNYVVKTAPEMLHDNQAIIRKLSGLPDGASFAQHRAAYQAKFAAGTYTEEQALTEFFAAMNDAAITDSALRLVGHNLKISDEVELLKRASQNLVDTGLFGDPAYRSAHRIDTYLDEVRKTGHLDFEDEREMSEAIATEVNILLRTRAFELSQIGEAPGMPLFDQIDTFMAFVFRSVAGKLDNYGIDAAAAEAFRTTSMHIMENLRSIKYGNSAAKLFVFNKETIPNLASAMGYDARNLPQLLHVPDDYFGTLAPEIVVDTAATRTLFKDQYIYDNLFSATEYAKRIGRTYNQLGDVEEILEGQSARLKVLFDTLQRWLPDVSKWDMSPAAQLQKQIAGTWNFKTDWRPITESTAKADALKALKFPEGLKHQAASLLWLMREVKDSIKPVGNADVSQTLMLALRRAIGADLFDKEYMHLFEKFDTTRTLYSRKIMRDMAAATDAAKKMAQSAATQSAEVMVRESAILKDFVNHQYDMFGDHQFYRFDKKYELAFASEMLQNMDELMGVVNKYATEDKDLWIKLDSYYDAVGKSAARYALGLRGDALLAHLRYNAQGLIRIDFTDWVNDEELIKAARTFMDENAGLPIGIRLRNRKLWVVMTQDTPLVPKALAQMPDVEEFLRTEQAMPEELLLALQKVRQKIHSLKDAMRKMREVKQAAGKKRRLHIDEDAYHLYSVNSTGTLITGEEFDALLYDIPEELRRVMALPSAPKDTFSFNYSNIGSPTVRNLAYQYSTIHPVRAYNSVLQTFLAYGDTAMKARLMLTSESSFVRFSNLFEKSTDAEILEALRGTEVYRVLMAEADDSLYGYSVRELKPTTLEDIAMLRKSEAIVVDHNTHRMLRNILNRGQINSGLLKFFSDVVVSPAKASMLSSVGVLLRNFVDSTLKNYMSLESVSDAPAFTAHTVEASRWLHIYKNDLNHILAMTIDHYDTLNRVKKLGIMAMGPSKKGIDGFFNALDIEAKFLNMRAGDLLAENDPAVLARLHAQLTDAQLAVITKTAAERSIRRDIFELTHTFIAQGPSAGFVDSQQKLINDALAAERLRNGDKMNFQETIKHWAWSNPMTSTMMGFNSEIEQLVRYSKFTWELKNNKSVAEAMHNVITTHFDYATKSSAVMYMELLIPFYTFSVANFEFWSNLMSKHGWQFGILKDWYSSFMHFGEYDQYEMQNNRAVQYALLNGTMPLSDSGFSMKLSPSVLDSFSILMQPFDAVKQRLSKAVSIPLSIFAQLAEQELAFDEALLKEVLSGIPFIGNYTQRYWPSEEWQLKGSAFRSAEGVKPGLETALTLLFPSIFSDVGKAYYFAYPAANEVWKTFDEDTYFEQLSKGATPVITNAQAKQIAARQQYVFYYNEKQYSTYNYESYQKHMANGARTSPATKYVFYYGDKEFATYDEAKYLENIKKGATPGTPIVTLSQAVDNTKTSEPRIPVEQPSLYYLQKMLDTPEYQQYLERVKTNKTTKKEVPTYKFYFGSQEYSTHDAAKYQDYLSRGATTTPAEQKTPVSFHTSMDYTRRSSDKYSSGVVSRNNGRQLRSFGSTLNLSFLAPAVWRRVYTAGGNDRFKVRLTKPTAKNLLYRMRMDWRYWR